MPQKSSYAPQHLLFCLLFFVSGFSGLMYQVLWTRQFKMLLGSSIISISIIVATFMAGLLLGSWWVGKSLNTKKIPNELRYYGYLELAIGIYGLILLLILPYTQLFFSLGGGPSVSFNYFKLIVNALLTFMILVVPTAAMGATLPLLVNYFSRKKVTFRRTISHFYGINALGAAFASLITGFFFIKYFGVNLSILIAVALNLAIGGFSILKSRGNENQDSIANTPKQPKLDEPKDNTRLANIVLATSFLTGFIAISYEMLWIRCLSYISNSSTYTFSIILFIFLLGIALGSFSLSYIKKIKNKILVVGILQYALSIISLCIIYLFYAYAYTDTFAEMFLQTARSDTSVWYDDLGLNFTLALLVFLLPAILMGMTFPVLSELYYENKQIKSGEAISSLYIVNTFGNILGALIPIFILIPLLGSIKSTLYLLGGLNALIALYYLYQSGVAKRHIILAFAIGNFLACCFFTQSDNVLASLENLNEDTYQDLPLFYKEGVMATVKVFNKQNTYKSLSIDGVTIASERFKAKESTIAHLPFFTNRSIKNVLAVGLASGSTVRSILKHKEIEKLDVVEIVPSVIDALPYFEPSGASLKDNPKVNTYIDDILSHLTYSDQKYDLISSDGKFGQLNRSNTTMLSKEYYDLCKKHLSKEGLFIQWITTEMPSKNFKTILQTTQNVFPHSELFLIRKNLYIISSLEPIAIEKMRVAKGFENPELAQDFYASYIFTPQEVLAYYVGPNWNSLGEKFIDNSLNMPVIEYDYNKERNKDIAKGRTSFYVNFSYLYDNLLQNKEKILTSENTITANEGEVNYEMNQKYMHSRKAYFKAHFAMQDKNETEMIRFFQEVINDNHSENDNNIAVSAKYIGEYYFQQKNYNKALGYFNLATDKMDGYSAAFTMKGLVYYYQRDTAACITNLEKALSLDPADQTAKQFLDAIK